MPNGLQALGTTGKRAVRLRPEQIKIKPGHNYRDMTTPEVQAHIEWLKESIKEIGVLKPIDVSLVDGEIYLEAGECRLTAAQKAREEGWDGYIEAFPVKGDEPRVYAQGLLDNGGLIPSKMDFGAAVEKLRSWGWTVEQIVPYIPAHLNLKGARAKRYVTEAEELHNAPLAVKDAVKNSVNGVKVSESLALAATKQSRTHAREIIEKAAEKAQAEGKTTATRPKNEGAITQRKNEFQAFTDKLLELADLMAKMILDDDVMLKDVQKKAREFQKLRRAD